MFGDTDEILLRRQASASSAYQEWEEGMEAAVSAGEAGCSLCVIEIGCGQRVPSVRRECEDVVRDTIARGGRATLIRINPEPSTLAASPARQGDVQEEVEEQGAEEEEPPPLGTEHVLALPETALRGLTRIAAAMKGIPPR